MPKPENVYSNGSKAAHGKSKEPPRIEIKLSWCKGCGLCVAYCNRDVLVMNGVLPKVVQAERCSRCLQCEAICPDFAIEVLDDAPMVGESAGAGSVTP